MSKSMRALLELSNKKTVIEEAKGGVTANDLESAFNEGWDDFRQVAAEEILQAVDGYAIEDIDEFVQELLEIVQKEFDKGVKKAVKKALQVTSRSMRV